MCPSDAGATRRAVLAGAAGLAAAAPGCLGAPAAGGPRYETRELDVGGVYRPGLRDETEEAFYAALVASQAAAGAFDLDAVPRAGDRAFVRETDFDAAVLAVVQVAGLNSSTVLRAVDVALTRANLVVVVAVDDPTPYSDDRVVTTLLVRVRRDGAPVPDRIRVELSLDGREVTFSGRRAIP